MIARLLGVTLALTLAAAAAAQPATFTYQGSLKNGGQPAAGPHDMRFKLFDAVTGGAQLGATLCRENVAVAGGLFAVQLDFGQQFTTPSPRFLEIQVRADIGQPCTDEFGYVLLTPRQAITSTPTATHAGSAFSLAAADGSPATAVIVDNSGKVGIGTLTPTHSVHIATAGPTLALQDTNAPAQQAGYVSYRDSSNTERAWVGYGTPGSAAFSIVNMRSAGDIFVTPGQFGDIVLGTGPTGGNVGIGTTTPAARLDVRGDIRLGSSGLYLAAAGEENLRIVRGAVDNNGIRIRGAGFTSQQVGPGKFQITFDTPFSGTPTATANADRFTTEANPCLVVLDIGSPSTSQVTFLVYSSTTQNLVDRPFNFIVIGPR